jgi:hypothetical protein
MATPIAYASSQTTAPRRPLRRPQRRAFTWTPAYEQAGDYLLSFLAQDPDGAREHPRRQPCASPTSTVPRRSPSRSTRRRIGQTLHASPSTPPTPIRNTHAGLPRQGPAAEGATLDSGHRRSSSGRRASARPATTSPWSPSPTASCRPPSRSCCARALAPVSPDGDHRADAELRRRPRPAGRRPRPREQLRADRRDHA